MERCGCRNCMWEILIKVSVLGKARSRSGKDTVFSSWGKVPKEY